jgi:TetR/AcrR family transcriptional repressor of nem operon
MKELAAASGLNPGSLHASFGNKEAIFSQAIARYSAQLIAAVDLAAEPRAQLEGWFETFLLRTSQGPRGCLMLASAAELAQLPEGAQLLVQQQLQAVRGFFQACLSRMGRDNVALDAGLLLVLISGLSVQARAGLDHEELVLLSKSGLSRLLD